jgi:hypothetical protein
LDAEGDGIFSVKEAVKAYFKYCNDNRSKVMPESEMHKVEQKFTSIFRQLNCMSPHEHVEGDLEISYS